MRCSAIARFFPLTAALSTILMTLWPSVVLARPLIINSRYPEVPNSNVNTLICYLQTDDGTTLDLDRLCNKTDENNSSRSTERTSAGRSSGSNLSPSQCYVFDANGRPCAATTNENQENRTQPLLTNPTSVP